MMNRKGRNDECRASNIRSWMRQRRSNEIANGESNHHFHKPNPSRSDSAEKDKEEDNDLVGNIEGGEQTVAVSR